MRYVFGIHLIKSGGKRIARIRETACGDWTDETCLTSNPEKVTCPECEKTTTRKAN